MGAELNSIPVHFSNLYYIQQLLLPNTIPSIPHIRTADMVDYDEHERFEDHPTYQRKNFAIKIPVTIIKGKDHGIGTITGKRFLRSHKAVSLRE
jgi:hypothetical protein